MGSGRVGEVGPGGVREEGWAGWPEEEIGVTAMALEIYVKDSGTRAAGRWAPGSCPECREPGAGSDRRRCGDGLGLRRGCPEPRRRTEAEGPGRQEEEKRCRQKPENGMGGCVEAGEVGDGQTARVSDSQTSQSFGCSVVRGWQVVVGLRLHGGKLGKLGAEQRWLAVWASRAADGDCKVPGLGSGCSRAPGAPGARRSWEGEYPYGRMDRTAVINEPTTH